MQECGAAEPQDPVAREPEPLADRDRVAGDALGVVTRPQLRVDQPDERVQMRDRVVRLLGPLARSLARESAEVLAVALRPVERRVGLAVELVARRRVVRAGGNAGAHRDAAVRKELRAGDARTHTLGHEQRVELLGLRQQQRELLATDAREAVDRADERVDQRGELP